jgi:hypothetical protein
VCIVRCLGDEQYDVAYIRYATSATHVAVGRRWSLRWTCPYMLRKKNTGHYEPNVMFYIYIADFVVNHNDRGPARLVANLVVHMRVWVLTLLVLLNTLRRLHVHANMFSLVVSASESS